VEDDTATMVGLGGSFRGRRWKWAIEIARQGVGRHNSGGILGCRGAHRIKLDSRLRANYHKPH